MNGASFIAAVRPQPRLGAIPAVVVTLRHRPDDRRRGITVAAQRYAVKREFDQSKLLDVIDRLLRR